MAKTGDEEKGPGRPEFAPTAEQREEVERLVACGWKQWRIAIVVGCSEPTLRKHFPDELLYGPARQHAKAIGYLFESAKDGNVSAQKRLVEILDRASAQAAMEAPAGGEAPTDAPTPRAPRLGKKDEEQAAAHTAGDDTDWGADLATKPIPLMN